MAPDELVGLSCQQVCQIGPVGGRDAVIATQVVAVVVCPAATKAGELVKAARVGLEASVKRAVVPLADQARRVTGRAEGVRHGHLAQRDSIKAVDFVLGDRSGPMGIAPSEQRGSGRGADRRGGIVLAEAGALGHQPVQVRRAHRSIAEATEVAVAHVIGHDENHVRVSWH